MKTDDLKNALHDIYSQHGADVFFSKKVKVHLDKIAPDFPPRLAELVHEVCVGEAGRYLKTKLEINKLKTKEERKNEISSRLYFAAKSLVNKGIRQDVADAVVFVFADMMGWGVARDEDDDDLIDLIMDMSEENEEERKREEEIRRMVKEKLAEEKRIAEEIRREAERIAEEKRLADEERIKEEKIKQMVEERLAEERRIAEEKQKENERVAEAAKKEEERLAEIKRKEDEEKRKEEEIQRIVEERLAEERRKEVERVAEVKRITEMELINEIKYIPKINSIMEFGGINWIVLDVKDDKALLLSEKIIEERAYHEEMERAYLKIMGVKITWAECDLRKYLNGTYYDSFGNEKTRISEELNNNPDNPWYRTSGGKNTRDKIFLLNLEEICGLTGITYFGDSGANLKTQGNQILLFNDKNSDKKIAYNAAGAASWWWLRSPGAHSACAADVRADGSVDLGGIRSPGSGGVRPALWLNMQS
jgi:hypothetical protein